MRDLNFLQMIKRQPDLAKFHPKVSQKIMCQLQRDVEFLRSAGLVGYSLLLGIEDAGDVIEKQREKAKMTATGDSTTYGDSP